MGVKKMKQDKKTTNKSGCTAVLAAAMIVAGGFSAYAGNQGTHGGEWKDTESLRWEWQNGEMSFYGNGSIFSEQHPEISDPEYYLKEAVRYPGEANPGWNTKGEPKANYSWASVEELQKFVNSFDWIHLDEKTRLLYVHNRIANGEGGFNQNHYGSPEEAKDFPVLEGGVGVCRDFAEEFQFLCQIVGLECVTYTPEYLHDACLVRIGTQWYATDPTSSLPLFSNAKTYPVDFETEFYRYENKEREQRRKEYEADPDSLANVLALTLSMRGEGTISGAAWEKIQAPMGQIEEQWGRQEISRQEYEKGIISLLKSVWGTEK